VEFVEPIRDISKIKKMKAILRQTSERDLLLFVLGINTGIKISDLLELTVKEVWDGEKVREFLILKDSKTGIEKAYYLNNSVSQLLQSYLRGGDFQPEDYLFKSKKNNLPISRQQAYRIINRAAREAGIPGRIGTHTLRKTFGYHAFRKGVAISILMNIFNHHSRKETLNYIGVQEEEQQLIRVDVNL